VAHEELYLIGPPGKLGDLENPISVSTRQLSELRLILPGPEHGMRQLLERAAERLGATLKVRAEVDALSETLKLVAADNGYTITSFAAARDDLVAGRVSAARIEDGAIQRTICVVRNPSRTLAAVKVEEMCLNLITSLIVKGHWNAELDLTRMPGAEGWFGRPQRRKLVKAAAASPRKKA
jgi:LysR family nitrogen assimilation transcriptional regulator